MRQFMTLVVWLTSLPALALDEGLEARVEGVLPPFFGVPVAVGGRPVGKVLAAKSKE